ncbi:MULTISPECIES: hypothetical protein [unclassified Polynucleobacter]|uniref:hypothetical protein n=1 Tax=unclassified Polynucleobacter TaxID=2640945 RepID=UPI0008CC9574|nr:MULTISPECIES: hypothetical protein [unclassified Polynucleobacter]OHC09498.1 MAG: hypothetical protein A2X74_04660 [Polynucleobacter sp. GWA2_45_21]HBK42775.1 hypothetical protein [Polynucleobacter sp.]
MKRMIYISLIINVVVLIPVCIGLISNASWVEHGYGPASPARGILLSIYGSILLVSLGLLINPLPMLVAPLLLVQVLYKLTTPFTVGNFTNPVVISNILVALVHLFALWLIFKVSQQPATDRGLLD